MGHKRATRFLWIAALAFTGCAAQRSAPELVGVANFRDVGGYRTTDGHILRRGLLYRSAQLSDMTPADREKLLNLGIRYEIDLRTAQERASQPSNWENHWPKVLIAFRYPEEELKTLRATQPAPGGAGTQVNVKPVNVKYATSIVMSPTATPSQVSEFMRDTTAKLLISHAPEIGAMMRDLAQEDAPALLHCSGGKDRTGVSVAVMMTLLGVPREEIYQEYLHSNDQLELWYRQTKEKKKAAGQPYDVSYELFRVRSGVDKSWLANAFQEIDNQYQSFDRFTQVALKLTPRDIEQLRARFIEN